VKTRVLDSWPILEWILARKPGSEVVAALLSGAEESTNRLLISAINVGEIYYFLRKNHSESLASLWRENSATLPITIEIPTADDIWNAASLKAQYPISYADAFAAALAQKHQCPLVTGDPEFRSVTQIELEWIDRDVIQ
jgi:ribonuclease VapC